MNYYIIFYKQQPHQLKSAEKLHVSTSHLNKTIRKFEIKKPSSFKTISSGEQELYNYIRLIVPKHIEVLQSDRTILKPKELYIYIPELKLAFEFNVDYWHSDEMKLDGYHEQKTSDCLDQGIHLTHIWKHDWNDNHDSTINLLENVLNNNHLHH